MLKKAMICFSFSIILLSTPCRAYPQSDSSHWRQTLYETGMEYMETGQLDSAEIQFKAMLAKDKQSAEAYYRLGCIADKRHPGCIRAQKLLKKTIKYKPDFVQAYYQLGHVYKNANDAFKRYEAPKYFEAAIAIDSSFAPAWLALVDLYESRDNGKNAVTFTGKALAQLPFDRDLFNRFNKMIFWYSQEELGQKLMSDLIEKKSGNRIFHLELAQIYFSQQKYQESLSVLEKLETECMDYSDCRFHYLNAINNFNLKRDQLGFRHYKIAIESITDSSDADLFYRDLCYIMKDVEYDELQSLMPGELSRFYHRFWLSRDPNLSTELNERLSEHYCRLAYARKHYRRYIVENCGLEFYHKVESMSKTGEELITEFQSKALPGDRELDDLGLIYVRHGKPDKWVTCVDPDCGILNISWKYFKNMQHPEMIFHFSKSGGLRGWVMTVLPITFKNRAELSPKYAVADPDLHQLGNKINTFNAMSQIHELEIENQKHIATGLHSESTKFTFTKEPLDFPLNVLCFKGEQGTSLIELYYGVAGNQSKIESVNNSSHLKLSTFLGVYDNRWQKMTGEKNDDIISLGNLSEAQWRQRSLVAKKQAQLPPGNCHIEFHLHEKVSDKLGVYKGTIEVVDYYQDSLMISDIILAYPIQPHDKAARFHKGDISYEPHMFMEYRKHAVVGLYFEIYNLTYDPGGLTEFEISYTIQPRNKQKPGFFTSLLPGNQKAITLCHAFQGNKRDEQIFDNLDTQHISPGKYDIHIEIKDIISGQTTGKEVGVRIK